MNDKADITAPVRQYPPNDFGLYNMAGNVNEWVEDTYRQTSFEEFDDFNPFRGNIYTDKNTKLADEYQTKSQALGKQSDSLMKIYVPVFQKNIADYSAVTLKFMNDNKNSLAGFYAVTALDQNRYEQQLVSYADDIKDNFKDKSI